MHIQRSNRFAMHPLVLPVCNSVPLSLYSLPVSPCILRSRDPLPPPNAAWPRRLSHCLPPQSSPMAPAMPPLPRSASTHRHASTVLVSLKLSTKPQKRIINMRPNCRSLLSVIIGDLKSTASKIQLTDCKIYTRATNE